MPTTVFFRNRRQAVPVLLGGLWLALLGTGGVLMARYESTAGTSGAAPSDWPATSQVRRAEAKSTLVMVAHPKCPCTRASISELAALMKENPGSVSARVLFYEPSGADTSWRETSAWQEVSSIPGVTAVADIEGAEAARFGGETSGDVILFDPHGHLVFHGGITAARGKVGPSAGHSAVNDLLSGRPATRSKAPVYGCPIEDPAPSVTPSQS